MAGARHYSGCDHLPVPDTVPNGLTAVLLHVQAGRLDITALQTRGVQCQDNTLDIRTGKDLTESCASVAARTLNRCCQ